MYCGLMLQVLALPVPCSPSPYLLNLIRPLSPIYLSKKHRNTTGPFLPPPQPINHQQRRRENHQSPRRGKRKQSHQRGIKDPSHQVGVTGGNPDPDPGALLRRRDQGDHVYFVGVIAKLTNIYFKFDYSIYCIFVPLLQALSLE